VSSGCKRLLVANRGEIARRVFATARAMGIETVAVYADSDAGAPFVAEADQAVALGGTSAAETYLDGATVLAAARRTGADAVHPGYGFLSENAAFARAVIDAGLTWVGPPPQAIAAMGDKLAAKRLTTEVGVPTLPMAELEGEATPAELSAAARGIGFPLLVKAAAGGGGKGMRVVAGEGELADAVAGARREAEASFGDGTLFLEKYLPAPRHVEIQILGDTQGNLIHLFERECSIQRRHQKIIEEAPSPVLSAELRSAMGEAALRVARALGYHSAGTVEFLVDTEPDGSTAFWFLEVNTRLQVEHPVTEAVTGLDLVRQQIRVAQGLPLEHTQADLAIEGHAIEARLYAEDVPAGFLPATGTLAAFAFPADPAVRLDSGVETGSVVGVTFDPMLAKVIAHGPTRGEAALRLALALERATIAGVVTNRDLLVSILRHPAFLAGDTTTDFIDRLDFGAGPHGPSPEAMAPLVAAVVLCRQAANRLAAPVLGFLPSGYRNSAMPPERLLATAGGHDITAEYRPQRDGSFSFDVTIAPADADPAAEHHVTTVSLEARLESCDCDGPAPGVTAVIDGVRSRWAVVADGIRWHVQGPTGRLDLGERSRFPQPGGDDVAGGQAAPMPGNVRVVAVTVGQQVERGQTLVVMEAMKMEHTIVAPQAATVSEVRCTVGDQVDNGQILVVLEPLEG